MIFPATDKGLSSNLEATLVNFDYGNQTMRHYLRNVKRLSKNRFYLAPYMETGFSFFS